MAFAGLHQVVRPVLDRLDRLPAPQASALRSAFALSEEPTGERFAVSLGVLGLLSEVAEERPLLCVVDDAQWLDQASADSLVFAARRLDADQLVLLFAARSGAARAFAARGLPELRLGPLGTRRHGPWSSGAMGRTSAWRSWTGSLPRQTATRSR